MTDYNDFLNGETDMVITEPEQPKKKSKRNSVVDLDMSGIEQQQFAAEITDADIAKQRAVQLVYDRKVLRQYVLDVLAFTENIVKDGLLSMESIIALVGRFDLDCATDNEIKNAVRAQIRAGMVERVGRSYRLATLGRITADEMKGAFKNSFRR